MTLRALFALFHQWNQLNRAPRTAEFYAGQLERVLDSCGDLEADQIRPFHLLQFKHTWHLILAVHRLFRWAAEQDIVENPAVFKLKRPRLGRRRRVLNRRELLRLLRRSTADFRRILLAYRETAARPVELRKLRWSALWIPEGMRASEALREGSACFVLENFKGRERRTDDVATRVIPITPRLGRMLWRLSERGPSHALIFETYRGKPWTYAALRCRMRKLRIRAGLPLEVGGEKIVMYTMRHSTATQWVADGMQQNACSELLGHSRVTTTQRYIHLNREQLLAEWRRHHERLRG